MQAHLRFPGRADILDRVYKRVLAAIDPKYARLTSIDPPDIRTIVPHPRLRLVLQSDPAMESILPCSVCRVSLGAVDGPPFQLNAVRSLLQLSPILLDDPPAMATAARWGLEAALMCQNGSHDDLDVDKLLFYGSRLLAMLSQSSRDLFLALVPAEIVDEMRETQRHSAGSQARAWLTSLVTTSRGKAIDGPSRGIAGLDMPLEDILVSGGDSRLELHTSSGLNKYGVPPRPRPEAIHFSSSTASAISDYGFRYCEELRRDLAAVGRQAHADEDNLLAHTMQAVGEEVCRMLNLDGADTDFALAPSGTDTELIAVMLALAGSGTRKLTNILIAPEESGRGVALAGKGCYFDDMSATGARVAKGVPAWPAMPVELEIIGIRDADAEPRSTNDTDEQFLALGRRALDDGGNVLAHVLWASKTGLVAPSEAAVEQLISLAPDRVDVVIDACQMRMDLGKLGAYLKRGWLLQVTGSKYLTGPPFSGALILPRRMRDRLAMITAAMTAAPPVTHADYWSTWWSNRLPRVSGGASFGPAFRWLPALLEANLNSNLPSEFCEYAFEKFRRALVERVGKSSYLQPISAGKSISDDELIARNSIVSFQVLGRLANGANTPLGESDCRWLFEQLNLNAESLLQGLGESERMQARQQAHIGQPVTLYAESGPITVLRMVIGARFFSIVGYAGQGALTAALESEIADAQRAIAKIELLASNWWRIAPGPEGTK
ncbi:MAG TPA: hypothetical protein PKK10_07600 [Woeseiaceae bacterium]|nr:hypothetical protein [Woeseiaceae bacterium]